MTEKSIFECPALIGFLVKSLLEKHVGKQVGKTVVQKMMYLLSRQGVVDFDYSMYHYGPYSSEVAGQLDFAESTGIVAMEWVEEKGYFIEATADLGKFEALLTPDKEDAVKELVEKYGRFNASELSIIATGIFLKDNFKVPDTRLAKIVHDVKPNHPVESIEQRLQDAGVINH